MIASGFPKYTYYNTTPANIIILKCSAIAFSCSVSGATEHIYLCGQSSADVSRRYIMFRSETEDGIFNIDTETASSSRYVTMSYDYIECSQDGNIVVIGSGVTNQITPKISKNYGHSSPW